MKIIHKLIVSVLIIILVVAGCIPVTAKTVKADNIIDQIISRKLKETSSGSVQDWIDGYLSDNADSGTEWYIIALSKYGNYDFTVYKKALVKYLSENETGAASSRLKYALTLIAAGERNSSFISETLENSIGEQGIMSLVFGLHILNNGYKCDKYTLKTLTDELLSFQSADGGWSLTGRSGDVDVTAMTVQALAPQYNGSAAVRTAIDKALAFLSACQNADGTYSSYGVKNPESISQVIIALSALGIDAERDGRFIKNSNTLFDAIELFHSDDGAYSHSEGGDVNATATVQVFCAAVAYKNMEKSDSPFYIFNRRSNVTEESTKDAGISVSVTEKTESTVTTEKEQTSAYSEKTDDTTSAVTSHTEASTSTENTVKTTSEKSDSDWKISVITAVAVITICLCAILSVTKKISPKGCMVLILIAVGVILVVIFTGVNPAKTDTVGSVTISIRCDTVKDKDGVSTPSDGVILRETELQIYAEDTVYDILLQACRENGVHLETTGTKETLYVEGINNLYEKDYGDLSGWMYFVNGESPQIGCGNYKLSDGDEIVWCYTCDMGADLDY
jgi:hypothetical protein